VNPSFDSDELRGLIDALCEESITPEQLRRLEELVLADPRAEAFYVQYMSLHADLSRHFAALPGPAEQSVRQRLAEPAPQSTAAARGGRRWLRPLAALALALAAGFLLVLGLWPNPIVISPRPSDPASERTDDSVAVLLQTHHAEWEGTGIPSHPGAPLSPGTLTLKSGYAQVQFYNGATVVLQGPAEFRLISRTQAYCARGKLRATVPPHAQGFTIGSPTMDLVDRGTEFGLDVGGDKTDLHVFQGKVDVYGPGAAAKTPPRQELTTGQGITATGPGPATPIRTDPAAFLTGRELADRAAEELTRWQGQWEVDRRALRADPTLLVYYSFQADQPWSRTLPDEGGGKAKPLDGAVVGCTSGTGRWPGKRGLELKRVSDRVRLHIPGEFTAITLAAWVRPDALPNQNNSLLMADGWDPGGLHWQIGIDGTIILAVKAPPELDGGPYQRGAHYRAMGVLTPERLGRWVHLAVVYDPAAGTVTHYVDGKSAAEHPILFDIPLRIEDAELGNWNVAKYRNRTPVRNFNGCIDEFMLFNRPLSGDEVSRLYTQGRPPG
jgi:ferric-dicitrate binding protein FerR (iron transport regulator)